MNSLSNSTNINVPWVEKYRPKRIDDIVHQPEVVKMLKNAIELRNMPHLLFYGPPGTGKTSSILALATELFGKENLSERVMELNASDDRGIAVVREKIKNWSRMSVSKNILHPITNSELPMWKILILDEADMMTSEAQSALRRIIEAHSKITRFVFICNYIHKIIDPIYSRCSKHRFQPVSRIAQKGKLETIIKAENVQLKNDDVLESLLDVSQGDLRRAITFLQSGSSMYQTLTVDAVYEIAGYPLKSTLQKLLQSCFKSLKDVKMEVTNVCNEGWDVAVIIQEVLSMIRNYKEVDDKHKAQISLIASEIAFAITHGANDFLQLLAFCTKINMIICERGKQQFLVT